MKTSMVIKKESDKSAAKQLIDKLVLNRFVRMRLETETRTLEQNAAQWPILNAFAEQLQWSVNGNMEFLNAEEWKDILTAAFRRETKARVARGLYDGVVMLGQRTSKFTRDEFPEWLEFLNYVAGEYGIKIPAPKRWVDYK